MNQKLVKNSPKSKLPQVTIYTVILLLIIVFISSLFRLKQVNKKGNLQINYPLSSSVTSTPHPKLLIPMPSSWTLNQDWVKIGVLSYADLPVGTNIGVLAAPEPKYENVNSIPVGDTFLLSASSKTEPLASSSRAEIVLLQPINEDPEVFKLIQPNTLSFYYFDDQLDQWLKITTEIHPKEDYIINKSYAIAQFDRFGIYSLRGIPTNPPPSISSITPTLINADQPFTLTVNGSNFMPGLSVVIAKGAGAGGYQPELISSSELKVTLDSGLSSGHWTIILRNVDLQQASFDFSIP